MRLKKIVSLGMALIITLLTMSLNSICLNFNIVSILANEDTNSTEVMMRKLLEIEDTWATVKTSSDGREQYSFQDIDFDGTLEFMVKYRYKKYSCCYMYKYINNEWINIGSYDTSYVNTANSSCLTLLLNTKTDEFKYVMNVSYKDHLFGGHYYYSGDIVYDLLIDDINFTLEMIISKTWYYTKGDENNVKYTYEYHGEEITEDEYNLQYKEYYNNLENNYIQIDYNTDDITSDEWLSYTTGDEKIERLLKSYDTFSVNYDNNNNNNDNDDDNHNTYKFFDLGTVTYEEANEYCINLGGHLATITSQEENDYVYSLMISNEYKNAYFGLTDSVEEGVWE